MNQSQSYISGLDIQSDYLTIAQYSPEEHAVMLVAIQPLSVSDGNGASGAVSNELSLLKNKFKFSAAGINCALPCEHAIIKKIPVDHGEKDIDGALRWELEQHIIGIVDDYVFDYQQCGTAAAGSTLNDYLVVAYRKKKIENLRQLLKHSKLTLNIVDLDIFALINVFEINYPEYIEQPAIIVHGEGEKATLLLTHQSGYIDHEVIEYPFGVDPQVFSGQLKTAAERLVLFANLSGGLTGIPVFVTGSIFSHEGFLVSAGSFLGDVSMLQPFRKVGCRIGADDEQLAAYIAQLGVAVGLAVRGND